MAEERLTSFRSRALQDRKARAAQQREAARSIQEHETDSTKLQHPEIKPDAVTSPSSELKTEEKPSPKSEVIITTPADTVHDEVKIIEEKTVVKTVEENDGITEAVPLVTKSNKAKSATKEPTTQKKLGRKKTIEEERKRVYIKCGDEVYNMVRKAANWSRTSKNDYMCSIVEAEMKAYAKNPEGYIASRSKKVAEANKTQKSGNKAISFHAGYDIIDFLNDIIYDVEGTRDSFLRAVITMDYEKKAKERNK